MAKRFKDDKMVSGKKFAGMPQEVIMKDYPSTPRASFNGLYDDIDGIDSQLRKDVKGGNGPAKTKY